MMLSAIAEAQGDGARMAQACRVVGLSMRTIERWRNEPERGDGLRGPHHRPHNALSPAEEAQVVSVLTSSVCRTVAETTGATAGGRRPLSRVGIDHLSSTATIWAAGEEACPESNTCHPSMHDSQSDWPEPGLELGHHLAPDDGARRIPPPVPRHGCLEPPHCRMASLWERESAELAAELVTQACREGNVGPASCSTPTTARPCAGAR